MAHAIASLLGLRSWAKAKKADVNLYLTEEDYSFIRMFPDGAALARCHEVTTLSVWSPSPTPNVSRETKTPREILWEERYAVSAGPVTLKLLEEWLYGPRPEELLPKHVTHVRESPFDPERHLDGPADLITKVRGRKVHHADPYSSQMKKMQGREDRRTNKLRDKQEFLFVADEALLTAEVDTSQLRWASFGGDESDIRYEYAECGLEDTKNPEDGAPWNDLD